MFILPVIILAFKRDYAYVARLEQIFYSRITGEKCKIILAYLHMQLLITNTQDRRELALAHSNICINVLFAR